MTHDSSWAISSAGLENIDVTTVLAAFLSTQPTTKSQSDVTAECQLIFVPSITASPSVVA